MPIQNAGKRFSDKLDIHTTNRAKYMQMSSRWMCFFSRLSTFASTSSLAKGLPKLCQAKQTSQNPEKYPQNCYWFFELCLFQPVKAIWRMVFLERKSSRKWVQDKPVNCPSKRIDQNHSLLQCLPLFWEDTPANLVKHWATVLHFTTAAFHLRVQVVSVQPCILEKYGCCFPSLLPRIHAKTKNADNW